MSFSCVFDNHVGYGSYLCASDDLHSQMPPQSWGQTDSALSQSVLWISGENIMYLLQEKECRGRTRYWGEG